MKMKSHVITQWCFLAMLPLYANSQTNMPAVPAPVPNIYARLPALAEPTKAQLENGQVLLSKLVEIATKLSAFDNEKVFEVFRVNETVTFETERLNPPNSSVYGISTRSDLTPLFIKTTRAHKMQNEKTLSFGLDNLTHTMWSGESTHKSNALIADITSSINLESHCVALSDIRNFFFNLGSEKFGSNFILTTSPILRPQPVHGMRGIDYQLNLQASLYSTYVIFELDFQKCAHKFHIKYKNINEVASK